jgi:hypothetical protein
MLKNEVKAQSRFTPQIGITGGINLTNFKQHINNDFENQKNIYKPDLKIHVVFQNSLREDFYFGIGIGILTYGQLNKSKYADGFSNELFYIQKSETKINYLQVPVTVGYKLKLNQFSPYMGLSIIPSWVYSFKQQNKIGYAMGLVFYETINKNEIQLNDMTNGTIYTIKYNDDGPIFNSYNSFFSINVGSQFALNNKFSINISITAQKSVYYIENIKSLSTPNGSYFGFNSFYISKNGNRESTLILYDNASRILQVQTNPYNTTLNSIGLNIGLSYNL